MIEKQRNQLHIWMKLLTLMNQQLFDVGKMFI